MNTLLWLTALAAILMNTVNAATTVERTPDSYKLSESVQVTFTITVTTGTFTITYGASGSGATVGTVDVSAGSAVAFRVAEPAVANVAVDDSVATKIKVTKSNLEAADNGKLIQLAYNDGSDENGDFTVLISCPQITGSEGDNLQLGTISGSGCTSSNYHVSGCSATFSCITGYSGTTSTSTCIAGTWLPALPTDCAAITCDPFNDPTGGASSCDDKGPVAYHAKCTITCFSGFYLTGLDEILCDGDGTSTKGTYDDTPTCAPITCTALTAPEGGTINCESSPTTDYGDKCTVTCNSGYHLEGDSERTCAGVGSTTGQFVGIEAKCRVASTTISASIESVVLGDKLTLTIDILAVEGQFTLTYDVSGTTTNVGTVDVAAGGVLTFNSDSSQPTNVAVDASVTKTISVEITLFASDNEKVFAIVHSSGVDGTGKSYTVNLACTAFDVSDNLEALEGGGVTTECDDAANYNIRGCSATISCKDNYSGTQVISTCQADGTWSNALPTDCTATSCTSIDNPLNGISTCSGSFLGTADCTITCNSGYVLTAGSATVTCQDSDSGSTGIPSSTDAHTCSDINECLDPERCNTATGEICLDTIGSYKCLCNFPLYRDSGENTCDYYCDATAPGDCSALETVGYIREAYTEQYYDKDRDTTWRMPALGVKGWKFTILSFDLERTQDWVIFGAGDDDELHANFFTQFTGTLEDLIEEDFKPGTTRNGNVIIVSNTQPFVRFTSDPTQDIPHTGMLIRYEADDQDCTDDANSACQRGSSCVDTVFDYFCSPCPSGWEGKHCNTDINECNPNQCPDDSTCENTEGSYNCTCNNGFITSDSSLSRPIQCKLATTTITPSSTNYLIGETLTLTIDTLATEGTFTITYDVSGSMSIVGTVDVASNGDVTFTPDGAKPSKVAIDDSINKQLTASITLESSDDQKIFSITHSSGVAGTGASYRVALNCPVVTGNVVVVSSSGTGCTASDYDLSQCSTTFNCDPGYYPASDVTALCTGGAWSIPLPICTEHKSCRAINVEHGQTTCESDANAHGSTCEITCDIGYLLSTNVKSILCNNGTWIGSTAFKCTVPEPTKLSFSPPSYLIGGFVQLEFGITVNVGTFTITYGSIAIGTATVDGTRIALHVSGSKPGNVAVDTNTASTIFVEISELASHDHGKIISLSYDLNGYYDVIYSIQLSCPPIAKPVYVKSSKPLMHD